LAERLNSELVRVDAKEWLVDTLLSATLLIGFVVAIGLDALGYGHYNRYIDPVLVTLLALCATLIPIKVLGRNLREVLKIAPKGDVSQLVEPAKSRPCASAMASSATAIWRKAAAASIWN
jgi:predicted Co/Zn/Cd cation transporter (cation efflux family)